MSKEDLHKLAAEIAARKPQPLSLTKIMYQAVLQRIREKGLDSNPEHSPYCLLDGSPRVLQLKESEEIMSKILTENIEPLYIKFGIDKPKNSRLTVKSNYINMLALFKISNQEYRLMAATDILNGDLQL